MQAFAFLTATLLLAGSISAAPSQSEQPVANSGEYSPPMLAEEHHHAAHQHQLDLGLEHDQQAPTLYLSPLALSNDFPLTPEAQHSSPDLEAAGSVSAVGNAPSAAQVEPQSSPVVVEHPQHSSVVHHQHQHQHQPAYYSTQQVGPVEGAKPQVVPVRANEQYGQPESTGLPPNYKPFGSWGLYIGGNPADGYYTNYYKALTNTVDKQSASVEPVVKPVAPASQAAVPMLRQAVPSSNPYVGGDFYSFAYSPSDLNSGVPIQGGQHQFYDPQQGAILSQGPADAQTRPFASPISPYADFYATKKIGQSAQSEPQAPQKGFQQRAYYYPYASPVQVSGPKSQQQVVSYPVPVGSQIVGSQPGVDGSFDPYGIHAFTRYAVKPTVVKSQGDQNYYYSYPAQQQHVVPSYKQQAQQQVYSVPPAGSAYSPYYGFYGYPMNQLHYSQGMIVPVQGEQPSGQQAAAPVQPLSEPSSDKLDVAGEQLKPQK